MDEMEQGLERVRTLIRLGQGPRAAEAAGLLAAQHPDDLEVQYQLARALAMVGDRDGSVQACTRALELSPDCVPVIFLLATHAIDDGDTSRALELLRRGRELEPGNQWVARQLAITLSHDAATRKEALAMAEECVEATPDDEDAHLALAECAARADDIRLATAHAEEALMIAPQDPDVQARVARIRTMLMDMGGAARLAIDGLGSAPLDAGLHTQASVALLTSTASLCFGTAFVGAGALLVLLFGGFTPWMQFAVLPAVPFWLRGARGLWGLGRHLGSRVGMLWRATRARAVAIVLAMVTAVAALVLGVVQQFAPVPLARAGVATAVVAVACLVTLVWWPTSANEP